MCGIYGIWDVFSPQTLRGRVETATRLVAHRGPDDEGFALLGRSGYEAWGGALPNEAAGSVEAASVALGHRRLSIIDLSSAGHQPFASADKRFWIVLNGEIYNYVELRAELEQQGALFVSQTDTEVVLTAWQVWGEACLERFNGMWSFAIFDRAEEVLFCSRDRFGVKPFNYLLQPGKFAFASETKQLLGELGGKPRLNASTLVDFLLWGFQNHTSDTFLEGIRTLPGGYYLRLTGDDVRAGRVEPRKYWVPKPDPPMGFHATARLVQLLGDSIRLRLRSDVPVGVTLSGGLDSSSITCLASRLPSGPGGAPLRAFTVVYPNPQFSEEVYARAVAEQCGLDLVLVRPESHELASDWGRFIWAMDEPFNSLSYYSNWKVYQSISTQGVPVLLNGQGGDELLLGYARYRVPFFVHLTKLGQIATVMSEVLKGRRNASMGLLKQLAYTLYFLLPSLRSARRLHVMRPFLRQEFFQFGRQRTEQLMLGSAWPKWPEFLVQEFEHYQLPHLLHHEDSVSMYFSIEARNPFLDYRLFNFILGQDIRSLLRDGWSKAILREGMHDILPERVRLRRDKMGFDTPTGRLIRDNAPYFRELLDRHHGEPLLNVPALRNAFDQGAINENVLCGTLSYLSWKEEFQVEV